MTTYPIRVFNAATKNGNRYLWLLITVLFISCSPTIHYLGDSLPATNQIDVYYDEKDVTRDYRTIGKMTHGNFFDFEMLTIKNKMIERAKANGGNGIIFMKVENIVDQHDGDDEILLDNDRLSITANVIKYKGR